MRLSEWMETTQGRKVMTAKVATAFEGVLSALGAPPDPVAYVVWGDDPEMRYLILASTDTGLAVVSVRVNVPMEGPRASGKLVRWSRVTTSELTADAQQGHRLVSVQVENQILKGVDAAADQVTSFMTEVFARIDNRVVATATVHHAGAAVSVRARTAASRHVARKATLRKAAATGARKPLAPKPAISPARKAAVEAAQWSDWNAPPPKLERG